MAVYNQFYEDMGSELSPTGRLERIGMEGWGRKLRGQVIRIAGILQVAGGDEREITAETMNKAVSIGKVLTEHTIHIFANAHFNDALLDKVWRWIRAKAMDCVQHDLPLSFKKVELAQALKRYGKSSDIDVAINELCTRNVVMKLKVQGKSSTIFINPDVPKI
jgi:hypothetical protein